MTLFFLFLNLFFAVLNYWVFIQVKADSRYFNLFVAVLCLFAAIYHFTFLI